MSIDCEVARVHEAGDHQFVAARVTAMAAPSDAPPLVFWNGGYAQVTPALGPRG